jgi:hypothetical protein
MFGDSSLPGFAGSETVPEFVGSDPGLSDTASVPVVPDDPSTPTSSYRQQGQEEVTSVLPNVGYLSVMAPTSIRANRGSILTDLAFTQRSVVLEQHEVNIDQGLPRNSTPFGLRLMVLTLVGTCLAALSLVLLRPSWLVPRIPHSSAQQLVAPKQFAVITASGASSGNISYRIPVSSYSISVAVDRPCWIIVRQLVGGRTLFSTTLQPNVGATAIPIHGSASIEIAAQASSISIRSSDQVLGRIASPVVGVRYNFVIPSGNTSAPLLRPR